MKKFSITPVTPEKVSPISLRLEPKLRYLAELQAREEHRTMTNFIEWAIKQALRNGNSPHLLNEGLWAEHPAERFVLLATGRPDLLTPSERQRWQRISNDGTIINPNTGKLNRQRLLLLQEDWEDIVASKE